MDGAKKTLLVSAITILLTGSVAAYAGMISVPGFSIQIPTPTPSSPPAAGQNMSVPSIPSGTQIPAITQPPAGVAALPSIAKSGQPGAPIYGNPSSSTDSTGSAGTVQNLAGACQASGGAWNPSTATCVTNTGASFPDQCVALGGQFNYTTSQCQMASLPGSGGGSAGWVDGEWSVDMPEIINATQKYNFPFYTGSDNIGAEVKIRNGSVYIDNYSCYDYPSYGVRYYGLVVRSGSSFQCEYRQDHRNIVSTGQAYLISSSHVTQSSYQVVNSNCSGLYYIDPNGYHGNGINCGEYTPVAFTLVPWNLP